MPKARVVIEMRTPVAIESPIASVLTKYVDNIVPGLGLSAEYRYRLYAALVTDALNEYSYDADLAGLTYAFDESLLGFFVTITGYNDKLHVLLRDVLVKAKDLEVRADRLDVIIEKVNDVSKDARLAALDILCIDQTRLGELFPWSKLSTIGLLRTIPYEREAVDDSGETTGS